jgi:hypothetical protein
VQVGPDAVYCHRRCADLELIDRLAVIRASVSAAAVLDALPDPRRAPTVDTGCTTSAPGSMSTNRGNVRGSYLIRRTPALPARENGAGSDIMISPCGRTSA